MSPSPPASSSTPYHSFTDETHSLIIVAAGRGVRMGTPLPKQYLPLEGRPILAHTVRAASALLTPDDPLILVIPPDDDERVRTLLEEYCPGVSLTLVHGGATRGRVCSTD